VKKPADFVDDFGSSGQKYEITRCNIIDVNWLEFQAILNGIGNVKINKQVL